MSTDREEERARCVAVCKTQVGMLVAAGAHEQAKGARMCADVLGLLTPADESDTAGPRVGGDRIDLAAIRARVAAATSGPWTDQRVGMRGNGSPRSHEEQLCGRDDVAVFIVTHDGSPEGHANVALTAHAPTDLASLCDEVERLRNDDVYTTIETALRARDEARAEVERLREIIAGRTTAPTDAEIEAHVRAGGRWLYRSPGKHGFTREVVSPRDVRELAEACRFVFDDDCTPGRWWALDASGAPCAWPTVTP